MKFAIRLFLLLAILLNAIPTHSVQAQDPSPWAEVFDQTGKIRSDVVDGPTLCLLLGRFEISPRSVYIRGLLDAGFQQSMLDGAQASANIQ
jgi:hypothetical protein